MLTEKQRAYHRERYARNRDKMRSYRKQHRAKNLAAYLATAKRYRDRNKDKKRAYYEEYYEKNKTRIAFDNRLRKYGLTKANFDAILQAQSGVCPICAMNLPDNHTFIAVDHDHETRQVRGLLHRGCNVALGMFEKHRDRMAGYLKGDN